MYYQRFIITSISEYISKAIKFSDGEEIWYRGHTSHSYFLEPSAYRYKPFRKNSKNIERRSIQAAQSDMLHINETRRLEIDLDWLCYLQHTGTPTRLLDWSFEFHVALFFAFEDYLKDKATGGSLPSIWAIKPKAFKKGLYKYIKEKKEEGVFPFNLKTEKECDYAMELLKDKDIKGTKFINDYEISRKKDGDVPNINDMYVPFTSPYVNERAKMQGGCFIRFPLLDNKEKQDFENHRLETLVESSHHFKNCLAKYVFIKPRKNIKELKTLNLDTSRIYPEVENIALRIKQRLFVENIT